MAQCPPEHVPVLQLEVQALLLFTTRNERIMKI